MTVALAAVALNCAPATAAAPAARRCHVDGVADSVAPAWAAQSRVTLVVDSVLLGAAKTVRSSMPCRRVTVRGRPALMIRAAEQELRRQRARVAPLVVVGLGYNSLWERERRNFSIWRARFDREAARLVGTLKRRGAQQIIWVTLREPKARFLTPAGRAELGKYSWYFPYVNESLRALARRRSDIGLADWTAVSNRRGLTYDSIHVTAAGALLMARTIKRAIRREASRQAVRLPR